MQIRTKTYQFFTQFNNTTVARIGTIYIEMLFLNVIDNWHNLKKFPNFFLIIVCKCMSHVFTDFE
jgi:hypothetical protein